MPPRRSQRARRRVQRRVTALVNDHNAGRIGFPGQGDGAIRFGPQRQRRPGEQQLAYLPAIGVAGNEPDEALEDKPYADKEERNGRYLSNKIWDVMNARGQKVEMAAAPLVLLLNPRAGKALPAFIYTRSTIGLHGSQTMMGHIPDWCIDSTDPNAGQPGQGIPVVVTTDPTQRDTLRDLFFVSEKSEPGTCPVMVPLSSASIDNPTRLDTEAFNTKLWQAVEVVVDVVMDNHCYFAGCWMAKHHGDMKGDGRIEAALQPFRDDIQRRFMDWMEAFSQALLKEFRNSEGRKMLNGLLGIFMDLNEDLTAGGHCTFPAMHIANNDRNVNFAYITHDIDPLSLHTLYVKGAAKNLPFEVDGPPKPPAAQGAAPAAQGAAAQGAAGDAANMPPPPPPGPPKGHYAQSFKRLELLRRIMQKDYDTSCPHPIQYKCSVPTSTAYADGAIEVKWAVVAKPGANVVQWGCARAGKTLHSSCKPFVFEVVGHKDVWGSGEEDKGAVFAALEALCYQNVSVSAKCTAGEAQIEYFERSDAHVITRKIEKFELGGSPGPHQIDTSKAGWKAFLRALLKGYLITVVGERQRRENSGAHMILNNGFQFEYFGKSEQRFHDKSHLHFSQVSKKRMDICCNIESLTDLDATATLDGTPFIDY